MSWQILQGDVREVLATLPDQSVQCVVTSPPYWGGVRDYGHENQIGLEREPHAYVEALVGVFREVRRTLKAEGVFWLNVGDVYAASGKGGGGSAGDRASWDTVRERKGFRMPPPGFKMKDLTLVASSLADSLRRDGWYLRSAVIWQKHAAVEPMRLDRPAVSHEYVFMLAKSQRYFARDPGEPWWGNSVWRITPEGYPGFPAAMPPELARRCVVCSSKPGDTVLDPFCGAGTTGLVADRLGRDFIGIELNQTYLDLARKRIGSVAPLFPNELVAPQEPVSARLGGMNK